MILHTVNKSPFASSGLASCLRYVGPNDAIVLLEDGVYAGSRGVSSGLEHGDTRVYAIAADVSARGLDRRLRDGVHVIGYREFVRLCTEYEVVKNWS